ncbi:MAG: hypothetical protein ACRDXB_12210, partial [Actinomycetes bacterium]
MSEGTIGADPNRARGHRGSVDFEDAESERSGCGVGGEGAAFEHQPCVHGAVAGGRGAPGQPEPTGRAADDIC